MNGVNLGLSVVEIENGFAKVTPFSNEIHSTVLVDKITLSLLPDGRIESFEIF